MDDEELINSFLRYAQDDWIPSSTDEFLCDAPPSMLPCASPPHHGNRWGCYGSTANKDTDLQALEKLRKIIAKGGPTYNQNLEIEPDWIPEKFFAIDSFDLGNDNLALPCGGGSWKKCAREMGWAIKSPDGRRFLGIKRTFVYYNRKKNKTNWFMDVFAQIENESYSFINTTRYLCHVFQSNKYDPRPTTTHGGVNPEYYAPFQMWSSAYPEKCDESCDPNAAWTSMGIASENCSDQNAVVPFSRIRRENHARLSMVTARANCDLNVPGSSMGITSKNWNDLDAAVPLMGIPGKNCAAGPCMGISSANCDLNVPGSSTGITSKNWGDQDAAVPYMGIPRENCAARPSMGMASENCGLSVAGLSTRTPTGKKRKTCVLDKFTEVSASSGRSGELLILLICNRCGMVYRKTSGTGTLANHKCSNY